MTLADPIARWIWAQCRQAVWVRILAALVLLLTWLSHATFAQPASPPPEQLKPGDVAPPLRVAQWIGGEPLTEFPHGKVVLVSFWASWSPPSLSAVGELNKLLEFLGQRGHLVGVTSERRSVVERFLLRSRSDLDTGATVDAAGNMDSSTGTWREVFSYPLAVDDDGATTRAYLEAAQLDFLPVVFLVGKDGHVEWIGHPSDLRGPLQQVLDDTWDREAFARQYAERQELFRAVRDLELMAVQGNVNQAINQCTDLINRWDNDPVAVDLMRRLKRFSGLDDARLVHWIQNAEVQWNSAVGLKELTTRILAEPDLSSAELTVAIRMIQQAMALWGPSDVELLELLALAHFRRGNYAQAVEYQSQVVELTRDPRARASALQKLDSYSAKTSTPSGEPPGDTPGP